MGGSTMENAEDPVDYNTNWDYTVDRYDHVNDVELDTRGRRFSAGLDQATDYGSIEFERRPRRSSQESSDSNFLAAQGRTLDEEEGIEFARKYPLLLTFQRYYLAEEDLIIGIAGYTNSWAKTLVYVALCVCTCGIAYVVLRWFPKYRISLMGNSSPLGLADWCVVENSFGELAIVQVTRTKLRRRLSSFMTCSDNGAADSLSLHSKKEDDPIVPVMHSFEYRYIKFYFDPTHDLFRTNSHWHDLQWLSLSNTHDGISQLTYESRLQIFGENNMVLHEKTVLELLTNEVLHPFYVFQVFSVLLWLADNYYYYAACIFIISLVSIVNSLVETKTTIHRLQQISKFACEVRVWRNGFWKQVDSTDLVPGEVFEVDPSMSVVPCDALLINGECVLNESMLTGESVPVSKVCATDETVQLLPENFAPPLLAKSLLYSGTRILKSKTSNDVPVTALAIKTGFNTTKGSLIRSMLFPKPTGFKFYEDSFKYIGFMTMVAMVGFVYSTFNFVRLGLLTRIIVLRALDIITIVVPPALPATLTIGTTFAIGRLKKMHIFCTSPTRVNVGGRLDVMCFDKTGTLTEDGLDILGVHVASNAEGRRQVVFRDLETRLVVSGSGSSEHDLHNEQHLLGCMASCHSLRLIDGQVLGDPLDQKMFEFSNWQYREHPELGHALVSSGKHQFLVRREFEFVSSLRRMSVVAENEHGERLVFTKGAPEIMQSCCDPGSLPVNFDELLHHYTHSGYRVIACAYKRLGTRKSRSVRELGREEVERGLCFAGFIVFENKLKATTSATLRELGEAKIRTVMCTGDNILTAVSVGRECNLLGKAVTDLYIPRYCFAEEEEGNRLGGHLVWEEMSDPEKRLNPATLKPVEINFDYDSYRLAITGEVFRYILTELKDPVVTEQVLMRCDIFARMSPDEKHELVEQLQKIEYTVGFCGDGANDCGALKAADVGISLSEAEASVAAPFTSRKFEILCVLDVIKEGRSSLVTSFSCFKYMSLYSAIQFMTITILYKRGTNLGDFQFLYIDMCLILPLAIFMLWSKPSALLVAKRPTANLVSPKVLVPLICHIATLGVFQWALWMWGQRQPWYQRPVPAGDDSVQSTDNTVLFLYSNLQYVFVAVVLSKGPPYREPISSNVPFLMNVGISLGMSVMLFAVDAQSGWGRLMQLTNLSRAFYCLLVVSAALNYVAMAYGESVAFMWLAGAFKRFNQRRGGVHRSKKLYKNLRMESLQVMGA